METYYKVTICFTTNQVTIDTSSREESLASAREEIPLWSDESRQ